MPSMFQDMAEAMDYARRAAYQWRRPAVVAIWLATAQWCVFAGPNDVTLRALDGAAKICMIDHETLKEASP